MKKLLLILCISLSCESFSQLTAVDTIPLTMNTHVQGKNYISWIDVHYDVDGLFIIEKKESGQHFKSCGVVNKTYFQNVDKLGLWWNEESSEKLEYRVILYKKPDWLN